MGLGILELLEKNSDFPDRYYWKHEVDNDILVLRPILREDMRIIKYINIKERGFLMTRCIKCVNSFCRRKWGYEEWYKFITQLNYKKKYLYMKRLREVTYRKFFKNQEFRVYY